MGALVRARGRRHARIRRRDRPALPLLAHAVARARDGPLRPQAPRAAARAVTSKDDQYARRAGDWTERAYADVGAYLDHRAEMIEAARRRLGGRAVVTEGDLNDYEPPEHVAATTVFRAIYYARDRAGFFGHAAGYTDKLVFDLNPRQYPVDDVVGDLQRT